AGVLDDRRRRRFPDPRAGLVRARLGRLGRDVRPAAPRRPLRAQPRRRARDRRRVLSQAVVLPSHLLSAAPASDRLAVDGLRGGRALAALAPRGAARSARTIPALLGRGRGGGLHTRGVEAALLPPAPAAPPVPSHRTARGASPA